MSSFQNLLSFLVPYSQQRYQALFEKQNQQENSCLQLKIQYFKEIRKLGIVSNHIFFVTFKDQKLIIGNNKYFVFDKLFNSNNVLKGIQLKYGDQILKINFIDQSNNKISKFVKMMAKILRQTQFDNQYKVRKQFSKTKRNAVRKVKRLSDKKVFVAKYFQKNYPNSKQNVQNQYQILKSFNHPNIIKILEFYENLTHYIWVMKYYQNNLLNFIQKNEILEELEVSKILKKIVLALQQLHKRQIVHRDLKQQNILITHNKYKGQIEILLIDLQSAVKINSKPYNKSPVFGTYGYLAPQVFNFKIGDTFTTKSDNFSLGCIFYNLLTKKYLFYSQEKNNIKITRQQKNKNMIFDLNDQRSSSIKPLAKDLLSKMLCLNPIQRISIQQILQHEFLKNQQIYMGKNDMLQQQIKL